MTGLRPAAFLDRDGVLNERPALHDYVRTPEQFSLLPGAAEAVAALEAAGLVPIVVSNQRGIARGIVPWSTLYAIEETIQAELAALSARIEGFHYCPHDNDAGCNCRKPAPGLLHAAALEHGLDLEASVLIGDSESDVAAGAAAGCFTVRIAPDRERTAADASADDLPSAVASVILPWLEQARRPGPPPNAET